MSSRPGIPMASKIGVEEAINGLRGNWLALEMYRESSHDGDLVHSRLAFVETADERGSLSEELSQADVAVRF